MTTFEFTTVKLGRYKISTQNVDEAKRIYQDVFKGSEYKFKSTIKSPFIIDCGAHIGLSVLYFKKLYPKSKILAFEPNPDSFKLLNLNLKQNEISDVQTINSAVSNKEGLIQLYVSSETKSPWTWGDAIVKNPWQSPETTKKINVQSEKLSISINQKVDLIKLDVEGSETDVMKDIEKKLPFVNNLVIEFHGNNVNKLNNLEKIIKILEKNSFNYTIKQFGKLIDYKDIKREDSYWLTIWAIKKTN